MVLTDASRHAFQKKARNIFGPLILGIFIEIFILGMVLLEAKAYLSKSSRDKPPVKILVGISVVALFAKGCFDARICYADLLYQAYRPHSTTFSWSAFAANLCGEVPLFCSQLYLCYRLWLALDKRASPLVILGLLGTFLSLAFFGVFAARRIQHPQADAHANLVQRWIPYWAFSAGIVDMYLSISFAYQILKVRRSAASHRLDYMLVRLASITITTCLPPALMSATMAIVEILEIKISVWRLFAVILSGVYTLCILHSRVPAVNSRKDIVQEAAQYAAGRDPHGLGFGSRSGNSSPSRSKIVSPVFNSVLQSAVSRGSVGGAAAGHPGSGLDGGGGGESGVRFEVQVTSMVDEFDTFDLETLRAARSQQVAFQTPA